MSRLANNKRRPTPFEVNDKVFLFTGHLSIEDRSGSLEIPLKICKPFEIMEMVNDVTFRMNLSEPMINKIIYNAFHSSLLQPFKSSTLQTPVEPQQGIQLAD